MREGFFLEQYSRSARKRVMTVPKFYFFDGGVARALAGTVYSDVAPETSYFGECFEHFVVCEMHRLVSYACLGQRLFTLNSQDGFEIDLILETPKKPLTVCEIKSTEWHQLLPQKLLWSPSWTTLFHQSYCNRLFRYLS